VCARRTKSTAIDLPASPCPVPTNIYTKIKYLLEGKPATAVYNFFMPYQQPAIINVWVVIKTTEIVEEGTITVTFKIRP